MLEVCGLSKRFGRPAVEDVSFHVAPGEVYALLGTNGAGKTTTLRMVCGLLVPDGGSIRIRGIDALRDPRAAKQVTAWLPDEPLLYERLTPAEYLRFVAGLWGVPAARARAEAERLLGELGLLEHINEPCAQFSRGMRQKTALAGALLHDPHLLIMDEPLSGLDAAAARKVKDMIRLRAQDGKSVVITTHVLEAAERMADRIGILSAGRLLAEGTLDELKRQSGKDTLEDVFLGMVGTS